MMNLRVEMNILSVGWYMKPDKCRGKRKEAHYNYLSEDFQYHRSTKAAVAHLKANGYSQDVINRLISKTHDEGKKLRPDKYDWIDGDDSVPEGWKLRIVKCSNGENEKPFFSEITFVSQDWSESFSWLQTAAASVDESKLWST